MLVGRLPREAQQRQEQADKRHREEVQRLKKQLTTLTCVARRISSPRR